MTHHNARITFDLTDPASEDLTDVYPRTMSAELVDDEAFTLISRGRMSNWFGSWGDLCMRLNSAGLWVQRRRPCP